MSTKVAVVTGGNKGIGFGIVRGLCKRFEGVVFLTSRDEGRGRKAVSDLQKEGLNPLYHQLDIADKKSVENFRDFIKKNYGGIDILVNNAAIAFRYKATEPAGVQAEQTLAVNFFGTLDTCDILFPVVRNGGRVVNISSPNGHLSNIPSETLRNRFKNPKLTIPELKALMNEYIEAAKRGNHEADWGSSSYSVAKVGLTKLTMIQQSLVNDRDIKVNAVHPGYVATDMSSHQGPQTIDEGAVVPLYVALDAADSIRGQYIWKDKTIANWDGVKPEDVY